MPYTASVPHMAAPSVFLPVDVPRRRCCVAIRFGVLNHLALCDRLYMSVAIRGVMHSIVSESLVSLLGCHPPEIVLEHVRRAIAVARESIENPRGAPVHGEERLRGPIDSRTGPQHLALSARTVPAIGPILVVDPCVMHPSDRTLEDLSVLHVWPDEELP